MIAAVLLLVVACLAPWAFGAVEPYWWGLASGACLAIGGAWLVAAGLRGDAASDVPPRARRLAFALPLVALVALLPVPAALRRVLSPTAAATLEAADPDAATSWRPLSLDPRSTLDAAIVAAACAVVFWVVARAARNEKSARGLTWILLVGGAALAAFGLVQRLHDYDGRSIYWSVRLPDVATPFGPYVNRNHFAGAMLLFLGAAVGATLSALAQGRRAAAGVAGVLGASIAVALAATTSRGALIALAVVALLFVLVARGRRARAALVLVAAAGLVIGALAYFGFWEELLARVHLHPSAREMNRFAVQRDALRVFAGAPVFGTGAGTFAAVYPPFQTIDDDRFFGNAHSDWAQFLMETGLVGAAFLVFGLREAGSKVRGATAPENPGRWAVLGPAAGCLAVCVHGFFETNLHVPANALLFAATLSLAYAAAVADDGARRPAPQDGDVPPSKEPSREPAAGGPQ